MDNDSSLLLDAAFTKYINNRTKHYKLIDGTVETVNDDFTCDVLIAGVLYSGVPIAVLTGEQASFYPIPVEGTACLIMWRDGNRGLPQIIQFDQIDTFKANVNLWEFNGGANGGLVLVNNLVEKVNNIENLLNNLIGAYNTHTHILTLTSGTGTAGPSTVQEGGTINPVTTAQDIESKVITQ
jgi:hypothetical protein